MASSSAVPEAAWRRVHVHAMFMPVCQSTFARAAAIAACMTPGGAAILQALQFPDQKQSPEAIPTDLPQKEPKKDLNWQKT